HDAELRLVIDVLRDRRDADRLAVADQRVGPFGEEQRALRQRRALLFRVVAVVQADADDLLRSRDQGADPTTPSRTRVAISSLERPSSVSTSTECSPRRGGGRWCSRRTPSITGGAATTSRPAVFCSIPLARVCGCAPTSPRSW